MQKYLQGFWLVKDIGNWIVWLVHKSDGHALLGPSRRGAFYVLYRFFIFISIFSQAEQFSEQIVLVS